MSKKFMTYAEYKKNVVNVLTKDKTWEYGVYNYRGEKRKKEHIIPLKDNENSRENRAASILHYMGLDCKKCLGKSLVGLHQYAHHVTSSQQLCMKFFSELIDENRHATEEMVKFMEEAFGIDINTGAECEFEYKEKKAPYLFDVDKDGNVIDGYEGTSFDFHIKDGEIEIYFEIKFTEKDGFKKEKCDKRHLAKAEKYLEPLIAPQFLREIVKTPQEFLKQYQIYRNVIRAKDNNKFVIFITDEKNPATEEDIEFIKELHLPKNVTFRTWQQLIPLYPFELPYQLKAIQKYL